MLNIVKYKGCKRCGGDLFLEKDMEGFYISCLQCSATYDKLVIPQQKVAKPDRELVTAR